MKAVLQYRATPGFRAAISAIENEWLSVAVVDETDKQTFAREIHDADVLLHVLERVTAATIEQAPRLRLIQKLGVGVDTIDLETARARGVAVCNMPGANTRAVAELTLLLMLATPRRLLRSRQSDASGKRMGARVRDRRQPRRARRPYRRAHRIRRGGEVPHADAARNWRTRHLHVASGEHPAPPRHSYRVAGVAFRCRRRLTARAADTGDGSDDQRRAIETMKRGAILVNTARGGLVDYDALYRALAGGRLRGAGIDVFESEPVNPSHPLFQLPNVVVTPHVAWFTSETLQRGLSIFLENCRRLRAGEELLHRVV